MDLRIDIESMRVLNAVVDRGSMARAADSLSMTPSAVSWKVKRLEQRLGCALLIRDGHDLRPTREGRILVEEANGIVEAHDRLVRRLQHPGFSGTIRVGSNEEVGGHRIAAILGRFQQSFPEARVEFVVNQSRLLSPLLARGRIDLAVIQVTDEELRSDDVVLWTDDLRWATHRDLAFDEGTVPLITYGENGFYRPVSEPILDQAGVPYRYAVTAPSSASVRAAVEAGLGVAVLGERFLGGEVIEWERGAALDPLPDAHQIVRTAPGETPGIFELLMSAIASELGEDPTDPTGLLD